MMRFVDEAIDRVTMYRLMVYYLAFLIAIAVALGFAGLLPMSPLLLVFSTLLVTVVCWVTNLLFASVFEAPANAESYLISALILALVITPVWSFSGIMFLVWASVWAMASKFVLAVNKKHVFNPVAIALVITGVVLGQSPSWWVGTLSMLPFVAIGGLLVVRKIRRFDLLLSFLALTLAITLAAAAIGGRSVLSAAQSVLLATPILFFGFVMLTEPLTTPPTGNKRMVYGAIVGIAFNPLFQVGSIFSTPELALAVGNVYAYLVSSKAKLVLKLRESVPIAASSYDFVFDSDERLDFSPGQYLEWTLPTSHSDSRGNRRYFTIASSPTEDGLRIGVRFSEPSSTFKEELKVMARGGSIVASGLAGDFVLPRDRSRKLVFIAGGIGITPFRSMVRYLMDKGERRNVTLLYSNRGPADIAYRELFDAASQQIGLKAVYTLTDHGLVPAGWPGKSGFIDAKMIMDEVPDFKERVFYISGPHALVTAFERTLRELGVRKSSIITDYFPGFA